MAESGERFVIVACTEERLADGQLNVSAGGLTLFFEDICSLIEGICCHQGIGVGKRGIAGEDRVRIILRESAERDQSFLGLIVRAISLAEDVIYVIAQITRVGLGVFQS